MCYGRFRSLYLNKTFRADRLVTAAGMINVGRVVL